MKIQKHRRRHRRWRYEGAWRSLREAPDGTDREGSAETPEHGLDDDGAFELVGLFGDVEANYGERSNEGQCREYGE